MENCLYRSLKASYITILRNGRGPVPEFPSLYCFSYPLRFGKHFDSFVAIANSWLTQTPEAAPNSLPPPTAPLPPCPSMLQIPPIESWDEVFHELRSLLYRLQARSWHACYKHYAIVKFMRTMCFTLGLRPCYGLEGGMELVARWVLSQQCPPHKLLAVRPRTVANWVHLTFSDTERLYLRFKEYIEGGGNIPGLPLAFQYMLLLNYHFS